MVSLKRLITNVFTIAGFTLFIETLVVFFLSTFVDDTVINTDPSITKLIMNVIIILIRSYFISNLITTIEDEGKFDLEQIFTTIPMNIFLITFLVNMAILVIISSENDEWSWWGPRSVVFNILLTLGSSMTSTLIYYYSKDI